STTNSATWQYMLMPDLGKNDVYEIVEETLRGGGTGPHELSVGNYWELSVCPEDYTISNKSDPSTSYVVNTGRYDEVYGPFDSKAFAVFHDHFNSTSNPNPNP